MAKIKMLHIRTKVPACDHRADRRAIVLYAAHAARALITGS
jgi:hypothetical protein